jgi:hypothetical protein
MLPLSSAGWIGALPAVIHQFDGHGVEIDIKFFLAYPAQYCADKIAVPSVEIDLGKREEKLWAHLWREDVKVLVVRPDPLEPRYSRV